jgi:aldose sugar dehydrogenase
MVALDRGPRSAAVVIGLAFGLLAWRGSLFGGGLVSEDIRRIDLDGNDNVVRQERLAIGRRIRDVKQESDGFLYVITDEENGRLLRIEPQCM